MVHPISTSGLAGAALHPSIMHRMGGWIWLGLVPHCLKFQQLIEVPWVLYLETCVGQPRVRAVGIKTDEQHTRCPPATPYRLAYASPHTTRVCVLVRAVV